MPDNIRRFTLEGKPVPYVRMTQRGKYVKRNAQRYLASKDAIGLQMRCQMGRRGWYPYPRGTRLTVHIAFLYANGADHRRDIDNEVKAVVDAGNGVLYDDDRWIDAIEAERGESDDGEDRVIVEVAAIG
jgi:Holliday junction resolvase RusA-like endonuclease